MNYNPHQFNPGDVLYAADLNQIDQQIAENEANILLKQDALVSGENVKTVNGESIIGSGNIAIEVGVVDVKKNGQSVVSDGVATIPNNVSQYNNDAGYLTGSGIKTVNSESLVGTGNVTIDTGVMDVKKNNQSVVADGVAVIPNNVSAYNNDAGYLVSSSFKTINSESIVGSGNIVIQGGGGGVSDVKKNNQSLVVDGVATIPNNVSAYSNDAGYLTSDSFKTVNGQSITGSGNIATTTGVSVNGVAVSQQNGIANIITVAVASGATGIPSADAVYTAINSAVGDVEAALAAL